MYLLHLPASPLSPTIPHTDSSPRPPSASLMSAASSSNLHNSVSSGGGSVNRRRKSVRESIDNSTLMNTVNTLANKVVSSNDR